MGISISSSSSFSVDDFLASSKSSVTAFDKAESFENRQEANNVLEKYKFWDLHLLILQYSEIHTGNELAKATEAILGHDRNKLIYHAALIIQVKDRYDYANILIELNAEGVKMIAKQSANELLSRRSKTLSVLEVAPTEGIKFSAVFEHIRELSKRPYNAIINNCQDFAHNVLAKFTPDNFQDKIQERLGSHKGLYKRIRKHLIRIVQAEKMKKI